MEEDFIIDEGKSSKFNAGLLLIQRINKIIDLMNQVKLNPLAFNVEQCDWNYNLWIRCINGLYSEVSSKFSQTEDKECTKKKNAIENCLQKYPISEESKRNPNKKLNINMQNWMIFKKYIEEYESKVRELSDKRGFMSPNAEDPRRAVLRR